MSHSPTLPLYGADSVYNRRVPKLRYSVLLLLLLVIDACNKPAQDKSAVQQALLEYLNGRAGISVANMDIEVTSVAFRENEADASVSFRAKGSTDATNSMQLKYVLEQKGGKWVVKGRSGKSEHGGMDTPSQPALPPGHPPMGASPSPGERK
jgi:hypothetical protein